MLPVTCTSSVPGVALHIHASKRCRVHRSTALLSMAHPLPGVTNATPAGAPAALPGAIAEGDGVLVHLQRADRGRVAALQVVPGPALAEALLVERVVVADQASRDAADAVRLASWSAQSSNTVTGDTWRAFRLGSPLPRTTRSPCSVPSTTGPVAWIVVSNV